MEPCAVRVGVAGWVYEDWKGAVYPKPAPKGFKPLQYLSRWFDALEVNTTFYRVPTPKMAEAWLAQVSGNPAFRFTAKLYRGFTHEEDAPSGEAEARAFREALAPLREAGRLGALLLQFPYRFHDGDENRGVVARLREWFPGWPLALEVRHRSWGRPEALAFVSGLGMAFCNIDEPQVSYSMPLTAHVTAPFAYLRLHGRNARDWFRKDAGRDARYNYRYSRPELVEMARGAVMLKERAPELYVIFNNHFAGQAVGNAVAMSGLLGAPLPEPPAHWGPLLSETLP